MNNEEQLRRALRELGREGEASLGEHPAPERLWAYDRGELPGDEAELVEEHLTQCAECARLVLALPALTEPTVPALGEAELRAGWQRFERRLREQGDAAPAPPKVVALAPRQDVAPAKAPGAGKEPRRILLLQRAAAYALVFGTGWLVSQLVSSSGDGRATFHVGYQQPPAAERGGGGEELVADYTTGRRSVFFVLTPESRPAPGRYVGRILDAEGRRVLLREDGLEPTEEFGTFFLDLPRGALAPGRYRVEIAPADAPSRSILDQPLRVIDPRR